jgi:uncharacterized protein with HEPN domain
LAAVMARELQERLQDLRAAISRIQRTATALGQTSFEQVDEEALIPICWSFVVIGEAIKALPEDLLSRHPAVDWRGFARFRDLLAHQYFRIEPSLLWKAISISLPPLDAAVTAELERTAATPNEGDGEGAA